MPYKDPQKQREYQQRWFVENKDKHRLSTLKGRAKMRAINRAYVQKIKEQPCMDCNIAYPYYVMDFDHKPGFEKLGKVADFIDQQSLAVVIAEIAKCDLVCAKLS